jgi:uncharacterized membrane protein YdjX (TVP38/TMEM64 family)
MSKGEASNSKAPPAGKPVRRPAGARWFLFLAMIVAAILIPFLLFEDHITGWTAGALAGAREKPLLGAGLIIALLAGDAVLPVPSSVLSAFTGGAFGWRTGALVIWIGMTLGALVGYVLGASAGRGVAVRIVGKGELDRARSLVADIGPAALIVTRAVPVLAEAATLVAGAAGMPFWMFLLSASVANIGVAIAYAGIGAAAASSSSFLIAFIGLVSVPAVAWAAWRLLSARSTDRQKDID